MSQESNILFIHPRRGLYGITVCNNCGYVFKSPDSDTSLVTYRSSHSKLELVDHTTQKVYDFPKKCPKCSSNDIGSKIGGVDELTDKLELELDTKVTRLDNGKSIKSEIQSPKQYELEFKGSIDITTRAYDPTIDYTKYNKIILIQAENLIGSIDYLTIEDSMHSVTQLITAMRAESELIIDTSIPEHEFFQTIQKMLNGDKDILTCYLDYLSKENRVRKIAKLPPFYNVLLFTSQEKNREKSFQMIQAGYKDAFNQFNNNKELDLIYPYPAKMLKRINHYSYHFILKYANQYQDFANLREAVVEISGRYGLQLRLNPRHLL